MSGMPWQMSYAASADLDNSELQTDVMRFMAILAFCLVAIFAIVQTMPLEAPAEPAVPAVADPLPPIDTRVAPIVQSKPAPEKKLLAKVEPVRATLLEKKPPPMPAKRPTAMPAKPVLPQPEPRMVATPEPARAKPQVAKNKPKPVTVTRLPAPKPVPIPEAKPAPVKAELAVPSPSASPERGLSLSFASDQVLQDLVARRLVGLYAIKDSNYYQMSVTSQGVRFGPGPAPAQYHEMVYQTVPREVAQVFEAQHHGSAENVVWGVTLPVATTHQLRRFVQTNYSGDLVITADAQLALAGEG